MPFTERFSGVVAIADDQTSDFQTWSSQKIDAELSALGGGSGGVVIDDITPATNKVYSSTKTQTLINNIQQFNYTGAYSGGASYAVDDVATYLGSTWIRVDSHGGNVGDVPGLTSPYWDLLASVGETGATGAQGDPGLSSSLFEYRLDLTSQAVSGIASGDIRFDTVDRTLSTLVWVSHQDDYGNDVERFIGTMPEGSQILIQDKSDSTNYLLYETTGTITTVVGSHVAIPVVHLESFGLANMPHNHLVFLSLQFIITPTVAVGTVSTGAPGSSAIVVNSGTPTSAVFDFTIPAGASGTSTDVDYTFAQFAYYGTSWTANPINHMTSSIAHIGGSLTGQTQSGTSALTKSFRNKSNVSATGNGANTGWKGASNSPFVYIGSGFKYVYSFGIEDTSTNASTRSLIGLLQSTAPVVLNNTTTVQSVNDQSIGVMQESGEGVFSFFTRGASSFQKITSVIPCTTPSGLWYTLSLHNAPGSYDVIVSLTASSLTSSTTDSHTFTCGTVSTPLTTAPLYVILQRSMSSAGGVTGSGSLSLGSIKMLYR